VFELKISAVDTTSDRVNLAVGNGISNRVRSVSARGAHDEKLFSEVERLLKKAGCRLQDLDALAAASGPGSFTGIRVGMTFVSVLAQSLGKPAAAVSLLEAEAARAWPILEKQGAHGVGVVYPAVRDELYFQVFVPGAAPVAAHGANTAPGAAREEDDMRADNATGTAREEHDLRAGNAPGAAGAENDSPAVPGKAGLRPFGEPLWVSPEAWPKVFYEHSAGRRIALAGPAAQSALRRLKPGKRTIKAWQGPPLSAAGLIGPALKKLASGSGELAPLYLKPAYYERNAPRAAH